AQLETGDLSIEDRAAFREWIKRSPRHYREIIRLARLSGEINVISEMAGPLKAAAESLAPIARPQARPLLASRRRGAVLAGLALALVVGTAIIMGRAFLFNGPYVIATAIGGYGERILPDGSVVKLNTASQIEVDYSQTERRVRLLKGEAFFDVAHNADHPFLVYAGDKMVRAVGTAFAVRWTDGDLFVTVAEGRVEYGVARSSPDGARDGGAALAKIQSPDEGTAAPLALDAGHVLTVQSGVGGREIKDLSAQDLNRQLSWRSGVLDFTDKPLIDVVHEMSRYTELKIEIADPALRDLKLSGVFRTGETSELFDALTLSFDVEVEQVNKKLVRLRRVDH
ncbi:MAG: FecR family protein, partial [Amphiplicatus sp.]